jgi:D-glycero-D-manno-heptose 1,7-bisphosphate phosphatase
LGAEKRRAVFLDRDGTLNEEKDYLYRIQDFVLIPGVPEAIRSLKNAGFLVIVVTNQSGVARGYFTLSEVETLHKHIQTELDQYGTGVDGFFVCPHHPDRGTGEYRKQCDCRKGEPGLLLQGAAEFGIDMARSYMVGDKLADIEAGEKGGCQSLLVLTGYGSKTASAIDPNRCPIFPDFPRAVDYILSR